jgi:hypothetical protein
MIYIGDHIFLQICKIYLGFLQLIVGVSVNPTGFLSGWGCRMSYIPCTKVNENTRNKLT